MGHFTQKSFLGSKGERVKGVHRESVWNQNNCGKDCGVTTQKRYISWPVDKYC